jgi:hypothetical protein
MTEEIKRIIHFDERRKILTVKTEQENEAIEDKVNCGKIKTISEGEYNEDGIKVMLGHAQADKKQAEKFIPMCQEKIRELEEIKKPEELPEDLKKLKEDLEKLKTFMDYEPKKKELENMREMLKNAEETLRKSNRNIDDIEREIGGRLNLK